MSNDDIGIRGTLPVLQNIRYNYRHKTSIVNISSAHSNHGYKKEQWEAKMWK